MKTDSGFSGSPHFATTRWSIVLEAGGESTPEAREALEFLMERSWYPLYAYLRRRGHAIDDARDLTQGFFLDLLERGDIQRADPARGRFRSFLLKALQNHVANEKRRGRAQKRGGGTAPISLDFDRAEERFSLEPCDGRTPERAFAANWAREILDGVFAELRAEYEQRGKAQVFDALSPCMGGDAETLPYREIADELDATLGAVKVGVHRMRARFRQILRSSIRDTLPEGADARDGVEEEIRELFESLDGE